jgi:hypothetical protein
MRQSRPAACLFLLIVGVLTGCSSTDHTATAGGTRDSNMASPQADGATADHSLAAQIQYRARCLEKEAHGGKEYVLTSWLDTKAKAEEFANYHSEFKYKGHRTRIDTRVKPAPAIP